MTAVVGRWLSALSMHGSLDANRRMPSPLIRALGPALGGAFFIPRPWVGALLWLGLFQNMRYAAFGLLGVAIAEGMGRAFQIRDTSAIDGSLKVNALLAAVAVAWLTGSSSASVEAQIALVVAASVAATIVSAAIMKVLAGRSAPPLTLGYCIVASLLFAIFPHWTYAAINSMVWWPVPTDLLGWVVTFFRTLGALLFSPTLGVGIVIAGAVLLWSRAAFLAGVVGWITGVLTASGLTAQGVVYYWMPTSYNFFLAGMALGAVFFLPGRGSLLMAAVAGCSASFLAVGLQHLAPTTAFGYLPIVTILTIWVRTYALGLASEQTFVRRNRESEVSPEEAWWREAYWQRRSGEISPFMLVPIGGRAKVLQGVDGRLSHVGPWRHALDFQGTLPKPSDDEAAANWNASVYAPAAGIVERVRNDVADNPPGICNYAASWGNYVIVRLDQGGWALLAHFRQGSIAVQPGMRVEIGAYLGTVGNSGRSPIPHLHLQVQNSPEPGAPSAPFRLADFLSAAEPDGPLIQWHPVGMPDQGAEVAPALPNAKVQAVLASLAPGEALWSIEADGVLPRPFRRTQQAETTRVSIGLDEVGRHVLRGETGGALVARLDPDAWRVLALEADADPLLVLLALAAPSVPYAASPGMSWEEPAPVAPIGLARWLGLAFTAYLPEPFPFVRCHCVGMPEAPDGSVIVETRVGGQWSWLPTKLVCRFDRLRGPTRIEAVFPGGRLTATQISFKPGTPFGHAAP